MYKWKTPKPQWAVPYKGLSSSFWSRSESVTGAQIALTSLCRSGFAAVSYTKIKICHYRRHHLLSLPCSVSPHLSHSCIPSTLSSLFIHKQQKKMQLSNMIVIAYFLVQPVKTPIVLLRADMKRYFHKFREVFSARQTPVFSTEPVSCITNIC